MKVTCGTDIIEIERIQKSIENFGKRFLNSIYTEKEIAYCEEKKAQKYQHYAGRFAAKEAIYKAISKNLEIPYAWKDYEILNDENGKPVVNMQYSISNLEQIEISISHCKTYAVATVVALYHT